MHMLNTVFLLVELIFGRVRLYWGYIIFDVITLGLYLGMAYLVHSVQNIWGRLPSLNFTKCKY
jgi:hypothetical protein